MWLHRKVEVGVETGEVLRKYRLNTVCEEAKCPNRAHCYSQKTATFLVLGKECTRACGFCEIDFSKTPKAPEEDEPLRVALSVKELGLRHVVITMVSRDDLEDGGSSHVAKVIDKVREENPGVTVEVLISDLMGNESSLDIVLDRRPDVFNHNIESVRRLSPRVRHKATYDRTLKVLKYAKAASKAGFVKSGMMVGLGETPEEVRETMGDLKEVGCDIITIGQYLQASRFKLQVAQFVSPEQFKKYEEYGKSIGIKTVYSGPFVRSSFHAGEVYVHTTS